MPQGKANPKLANRRWLAARIRRGLTAAQIAAEAGSTDRAVRYAVIRHGLPHAATPPRPKPVDEKAVVAMRRSGATVHEVARQFRIADERARRILADAGVSSGRQASRYPQLNDREWLAVRLEVGATIAGLAREIGCDRNPVRKALKRFDLMESTADARARAVKKAQTTGGAEGARKWLAIVASAS